MSAIQQAIAALGGASGPTQGQYLYSGFTEQSWSVPAGVTSVCIVCVQEGGPWSSTTPSTSGSPCDVLRSSNSETLVRAQNGSRVGDGGGDGGTGGTTTSTWLAGGGGAGGYSGNGGNGSSSGGASTSATGGGGGGGGRAPESLGNGYGGGGVGVLGQGSSGAGGADNAGGEGGSGGGSGGAGSWGQYGGGMFGGKSGSLLLHAGRGGALSYKNNITVTPGESLLLRPYGAGGSSGAYNPAIRIIWGAGRAFPSTNTTDV